MFPTQNQPIQTSTALKITPPIHQLPSTGFFRLPQIIGTKGNPPLIPVSRTTWLNGVKSGIYPAPVKLNKRSIGWRVSDIYALIDQMGA